MSKLAKAQTQQGHSKGFFEYIRAIGECKSKQEEDKIVAADLVALKQLLTSKKSGTGDKYAKEAVVRVFYAEMLGHGAEFGHIHCVNLASSHDLLFKRTGYLATWLTVNPDHEFMYLIVASLQRDMKSNAFLEVATALTAAAKLVKPELMSAINPEIIALAKHSNAFVRKRVAGCMHAFWRKSDGAIGDHKEFRQMLCDRDPSVMGACLAMYLDVCLGDPDGQRDLLPSFVSILKQVVEHRLSREYSYHGVPSPWMQVQLLKIIAVLAGQDESASRKCVDALMETMKRADNNLNIGYAIIYEAVNTVTSLFPIPQLIEAAADYVAKFLTSNNSNFKYLGVTALSKIVKISPKYAQEHQAIVIACLEHSDDTIRRKTLSLLFAMCNEDNVEPITARLIKFLSTSTDRFQREELVRNICTIAELYSPSNDWYIETMNKTLELAAEHVPQPVIQGMLKLIAEGAGDDEAEDAQFRTQCVEDYFDLVEGQEKKLPSALYQIVAWVLGEYGFLTRRISRAMMIDRLCDMIDRVNDAETKGWIITALMKVIAHNGTMPENVEDIVIKLQASRNVALQQRCYEFMAMSRMLPLLKRCLPLDGCCEEIDVDLNLSFLDNIVQVALTNGALPYQKKEKEVKATEGIRMEAYKLTQPDVLNEEDPNADKFGGADEPTLVIRGGARVWGAKNLQDEGAVDKPVVAESPSEAEAAAAGSGATHADPMAILDGPKKVSKNEKFLSDILGGGGGTAKKRADRKKRGTDRAAETARLAAIAEAETEGLTLDEYHRQRAADHPDSEGEAPHRRGVAGGSAAAAPHAAAGPSTAGTSTAKVDIDIRKNLTVDAMLVRFGVLSNEPLRNIVFKVTPPAKCAIDLKSAEDNVPAVVHDNEITFQGTAPGKPVFALGRVRGLDYPTGGFFSITVTYESPSGTGTKTGQLPLGLVDLVRPLQTNTEQFGKNWPTHAATEVRVQLKFPAALTPEKLAQFLREKSGIGLVQVINKECIAAGRVIPAGPPILLHMAVNGNIVNASVRAASKEFGQAVGNTLAAAAAAMPAA
jgi:AP-4 complex subunit epsilon-1